MEKKILFAGGGTAGSVTPLIAVYDYLIKKQQDLSFAWVGTTKGPEKKILSGKPINYHAIAIAKIDRFFSFRNLVMPAKFIYACWQSYKIIKREKPDVICAAGGFVAVPLVFTAWFFKIPTIIHQLDIRPTLSNKLLAPFSRVITVTFEKSLHDFPEKKTFLVGAPVRKQFLEPQRYTLPFHHRLPVVLIMGGGTGSQAINDLVAQGIDELTGEVQVVHITGKDKSVDIKRPNYFQYEFLNEQMAEVMQRSDVVVARAGLGTFLELAALKKPSIIIPNPNSHQEDNADYFQKAKCVLVANQNGMSPQIFTSTILKLVHDQDLQQMLSSNIALYYRPDAVEKIVEKIKEIVYNNKP